MELRYYQKDAVEAANQSDGTPLVVIPTGGGKSICLAYIAKHTVRNGGRVLLLTHVKELLEQNREKVQIVAPEISCGYYCAGLEEKKPDASVVFGSINSVYGNVDELGHLDTVLIDEAQRVNAKSESLSMYKAVLAELQMRNPGIKIVGMTATPYRLDSGPLVEGGLFTHICYDVTAKELIDAGYLSQIRAYRGTDPLKAYEQLRSCKGGLVFQPDVKRAEEAERQIRALGIDVAGVYGTTPWEERAQRVTWFREGRLQALVSVDVLTTGFDAPHVDLLINFRKTSSCGLHYQTVGRGFRKAPGKTECKVIDFTNNFYKHGLVDDPRIQQTSNGTWEFCGTVTDCPTCGLLTSVVYGSCEQCRSLLRSEVAKADDYGGMVAEQLEVSGNCKCVQFASVIKNVEIVQKPGVVILRYTTEDGPYEEAIFDEHRRDMLFKMKWMQLTGKPYPFTVQQACDAITFRRHELVGRKLEGERDPQGRFIGETSIS